MVSSVSTFLALWLAMAVYNLCLSVYHPALYLELDADNFSATYISFASAICQVGFFAAGALTPFIARTFSARVSLLAAFPLMALLVLATHYFAASPLLFLVEFTIGLIAATIKIRIKSSLVVLATSHRRSTVLSVVGLGGSLAWVLGPYLAGQTDVYGWRPFEIGAASLLVMVPIFLMLSKDPSIDTRKTVEREDRQSGLLEQVRRQPNLVLIPLCIALIGSPFRALLPIYGEQALGLEAQQAATLLSWLGAGSLVLAVPVAWLGDRLGVRRVLIAAAVVIAVACGYLYQASAESLSVETAIFLMSGLKAAMSHVALAFVVGRLSLSQVPAMVAVFIVAGKVGSIAGTISAGAMMTEYGPHALFVVPGAAAIALCISLLQTGAAEPEAAR